MKTFELFRDQSVYYPNPEAQNSTGWFTVDVQYVPVTIDGMHFVVNPRNIEFSNEHKIEEKKIPYYKDISIYMGEGLWHLTLTLRTLKMEEKNFLWNLGTLKIPGPHLLLTSASGYICMFVKNKRCVQVQGESDNVFLWTLEFTEDDEQGEGGGCGGSGMSSSSPTDASGSVSATGEEVQDLETGMYKEVS